MAVTTTAACDAPEAGAEGFCESGEVATRKAQSNGDAMNGTRLNGTRLNGTRLNGTRLNGTRLNGPDGSADYIELNQITLHGNGVGVDSWLDGSMLVVRANDDTLVAGAALDSAKLRFDVREGALASKMLKILDVEPLAPGSDTWLFDMSLQVASEGWVPLCLDGAAEPTQAILLPDVWDPETGDRLPSAPGSVTFACRDGALAKCVEWGYRPWMPELRDLHQACTRLVRADYCGDGVPHTQPGTMIHVLDQVGIQDVDATHSFVVEAEWGPDGAVCLNSGNMRLGEQALGCEIPACGAPFASGGLIQSGKIVPTP